MFDLSTNVSIIICWSKEVILWMWSNTSHDALWHVSGRVTKQFNCRSILISAKRSSFLFLLWSKIKEEVYYEWDPGAQRGFFSPYCLLLFQRQDPLVPRPPGELWNRYVVPLLKAHDSLLWLLSGLKLRCWSQRGFMTNCPHTCSIYCYSYGLLLSEVVFWGSLCYSLSLFLFKICFFSPIFMGFFFLYFVRSSAQFVRANVNHGANTDQSERTGSASCSRLH